MCAQQTETERIVLENLVTKIIIEKRRETLQSVWICTFIISFWTNSWPMFSYLKWPCNLHVRCACCPWQWGDKTSRVFTLDTLPLVDPWNADTCWGHICRHNFMLLCSVFGKANGLSGEVSDSCPPGGRCRYGGDFLSLSEWLSFPGSTFLQTWLSKVEKKFFWQRQ